MALPVIQILPNGAAAAGCTATASLGTHAQTGGPGDFPWIDVQYYNLTATAANGWRFAEFRWVVHIEDSVEGSSDEQGSSQSNPAMDGPYEGFSNDNQQWTTTYTTTSIIAVFENEPTPTPTHTITAVAQYPSAEVRIDGGTWAQTATVEVADGSSVTVEAKPTCVHGGANYRFRAWHENGASVSDSTSYTFTVDRDRTLIATYSPTFPVTVRARYLYTNDVPLYGRVAFVPSTGQVYTEQTKDFISGETASVMSSLGTYYINQGWRLYGWRIYENGALRQEIRVQDSTESYQYYDRIVSTTTIIDALFYKPTHLLVNSFSLGSPVRLVHDPDSGLLVADY